MLRSAPNLKRINCVPIGRCVVKGAKTILPFSFFNEAFKLTIWTGDVNEVTIAQRDTGLSEVVNFNVCTSDSVMRVSVYNDINELVDYEEVWLI